MDIAHGRYRPRAGASPLWGLDAPMKAVEGIGISTNGERPGPLERARPPLSSVLDLVFDLLGVAVFAASGALAAGRKHLDWFGVGVLAVVTAVGGGTLRDVLLDRHPVFWIDDPRYLGVIVAAAAVTMGVAHLRHVVRLDTPLLVADALGLAFFGIRGAQIAEASGLSWPLVLLMGTITATAGGAIRDVLTAEIPLVLQRGRLYATTVLAGVALYLALEAVGVGRGAASLVGMGVIAALRFAAIAWRLSLPVFRLPDDPASGNTSTGRGSL